MASYKMFDIYVDNEVVATINEEAIGAPTRGATAQVIASGATITVVFKMGYVDGLGCTIVNTNYSYSGGVESNLVITSPVKLSDFDDYGEADGGDVYLTSADPYTITISNKDGINLLVEGKYLAKDITILLDESLFKETEEGGGESDGTNSWKVKEVSGATYGFTLNSSTGYYVSGNKGKGNSCAICKVVLNVATPCRMYVDCINYAESNYDYGLLSTLDNPLSISASADSSNVFKSFRGLQSANVVSVDYGTIPTGSHFIYVKFIKDSSVDRDNDSLQFTVRLE